MNALLTEKYRPQTISDFAGLDKVKRILSRFAANPQAIAFRFVGASGTGKTSMAYALASEIQAEVIHVRSQEANLQRLQDVCHDCHYVPMSGKSMYMVIVDEAHEMSHAAQNYLLSVLDGTEAPPNTIWVFTATSEESLEVPFKSRTLLLEFSTYGVSSSATELLSRIWSVEVGADSETPNFARLVKDAGNNIRESLMSLQREIFAA